MNELSEKDTSRALRLILLHGALMGGFWAVGQPASAVLQLFGLDIIGISKENIGLLNGVVWLAGGMQILSFLVSRRLADKRRLVVVSGFLEVAFLLSVLLLPVLFPGRHGWLFFLLLGCGAICCNIMQPFLGNWTSAVIPPAVRGRFLSRRAMFQGVLMTLGGFVALWAVEKIPSAAGFTLVIVCGSLMAIGASLALAFTPMPADIMENSDFHAGDLLASLRHQPFRRYLMFVLALQLPFSFACGYYGAFFRREIGLSPTEMSYYLTAYNIIRILFLYPVGKLTDRFGAKSLLSGMVGVYSLFFLMFMFFNHGSLPAVVIAWGFVGIADAVYAVAATSTLYHSLPQDRRRTSCLALAQGLPVLMLGIGPFFVRIYLEYAENLRFTLLGCEIERFRLLYISCGILVLSSLMFLRRVEDTREVRFTQLVWQGVRDGLIRLRPRFWRL